MVVLGRQSMTFPSLAFVIIPINEGAVRMSNFFVYHIFALVIAVIVAQKCLITSIFKRVAWRENL